MLQVQYNLKHAVIDMQKRNPGKRDLEGEVLYFTKCLPVHTVVEIHSREYDIHFITKLESMLGMNLFVNELGPKHFRFMAIKLL